MKKRLLCLILIFSIALISFGQAAEPETPAPSDATAANEESAPADPNAVIIAAYTKVIEADPKNAEAYLERGIAYKAKKEIDLALADFGRAVELKPKLASAYEERGRLYLENKQYAEAIKDYTALLKLEPKHADAYFRRGVCYYYEKKYETALKDVDKAINLNDKHAGAYLVKAVCYQKLDNNPEAIKAYRSLLANVSGKEQQEAVDTAKRMLKSLGVEP